MMKAALLPDRGVVKVVGDDAAKLLNGIVTVDAATVAPGRARFTALLTPQGKIIADFILAVAAPEDGGGFFLDVPRALAPTLVQRLNLYKLRAKVMVEDLSETLGVLAIWGGKAETEFGLCYPDPRLPELGARCMLPPHLAERAAADLGAEFVGRRTTKRIASRSVCRRAGSISSTATPFRRKPTWTSLPASISSKGCFVGQEVVSRMKHRGLARSRVVPIAYDGFAPDAGTPVTAGEKSVGTLGSTAHGHGLAMLRLDRVADALAAGAPLVAGTTALRLVKPSWASFDFPGDARAAE